MFLRRSLWVVPVAGMVAALLVARGARWVDDRTHWVLMGFGSDGAKALLSTISAAHLTFVVFAFSILLLAVQLASSQLSPRIIARVFENRFVKLVLGAFVFTFTYSVSALSRAEERVPELTVLLSILFSLMSIVLFIYMMQSIGRGFRPITILTNVADDTRAVIQSFYPHPFVPGAGERPGFEFDRSLAVRTVTHQGRPGVILAFDASGLVAEATRAACSIELVPRVGDFIETGDALYRLRGDGAPGADEARLRDSIMIGLERTLDQDPAFGLRIIVDIASKALSPAINDPTTGVLAIDQLQHLLGLLGQRSLHEGVARDASGAVRLVHRTQDWADFVALAATEIRLYGAQSPQVTRRLQAMFEHLLSVVPAERAGVVRDEMALLRQTIDAAYVVPGDRAIAAVGDLQGFGSRTLRRDSA